MRETAHASSSLRASVIACGADPYSSEREDVMTRRIVLTSALCVAALTMAASVSAQVTNMSDGTGASAGLFSRGLVRAFPAPPAPDPVPIVTPAVLAALCVERADALAVYTSLSGAWADDAQLTALML